MQGPWGSSCLTDVFSLRSSKKVIWQDLRSPKVVEGFSGGTRGKEPTGQGRRCKRHGFDCWVGKIPWRRKWQPTPVRIPWTDEAWWTTVHRVEQSWTRLKWLSMHARWVEKFKVWGSRFYLIFWHGPFVKVFIELVAVFLLFYVLVFWPWCMWDLNSLARDWTHTPSIERWSLNHCTTGEVLRK